MMVRRHFADVAAWLLLLALGGGVGLDASPASARGEARRMTQLLRWVRAGHAQLSVPLLEGTHEVSAGAQLPRARLGVDANASLDLKIEREAGGSLLHASGEFDPPVRIENALRLHDARGGNNGLVGLWRAGAALWTWGASELWLRGFASLTKAKRVTAVIDQHGIRPSVVVEGGGNKERVNLGSIPFGQRNEELEQILDPEFYITASGEADLEPKALRSVGFIGKGHLRGEADIDLDKPEILVTKGSATFVGSFDLATVLRKAQAAGQLPLDIMATLVPLAGQMQRLAAQPGAKAPTLHISDVKATLTPRAIELSSATFQVGDGPQTTLTKLKIPLPKARKGGHHD